MKKILTVLSTALIVVACGPQRTYAAPTVDNVTDGSPYYYTAPGATPIGPGTGAKATTDSGINHLPVYHGHMQTNKTYRFVNVAEQVFTMIGDGKHGLWRYQDNGTVREYITDEAEASGDGLDEGLSIDDPSNLPTLEDDYTHFDESASFGSIGGGGYKSIGGFNGQTVNADGHQTFVDLPIFHPKYGGKYDEHPPIDLAGYYCTMSANDYAKARQAMDFAFAQPGAGHDNVGPLGIRAGLDISENYTKVLRLHSLPDARIWANTKDRDEALWQQINTHRTKAETYLVERPFFNEDYLFIVVVFDDKRKKREHSYIRPDGTYYDHLMERKDSGEKLWFDTRLNQRPHFNVLRERDGEGRRGHRLSRARKHVDGTRLYGVHHPGGLTVANGACPSMGGDFGETYYGSAWPNNYQEITPLCDGILIDIKLYANLDGVGWDSEAKNLANNTGTVNGDGTTLTAGELEKNYINVPGAYGDFSEANADPYMLIEGIVNHEAFTADGTDELHFPSANDQVEINE